ncbi:hypothetical protein [Spirosoma koreense]
MLTCLHPSYCGRATPGDIVPLTIQGAESSSFFFWTGNPGTNSQWKVNRKVILS